MMQKMRSVSRYIVCAILLGLFGSATQVLADTIKIKATAKGPAYDLQQAAKAGSIPEGMLKDAEGKTIDAKAYTGSLVNANGQTVTPETARVQPKGEYTLDTTAKPADFDPFARAEAVHYRKVTKRWYCKRHARTHTKRVRVRSQISWSASAVGGRVTVEPALTVTRQPGEVAEFTIKATAKSGEALTDLKVLGIGDVTIVTKTELQGDKLILVAGNPGTTKVVIVSESDSSIKAEVGLRVLQPEIARIVMLDNSAGEPVELTLGDESEAVEFEVSTPNYTVIDNVALRIHNSNPKAVKAELKGQTLTLTPIAKGEAVVSVRAARVLSPTTQVEVNVVDKPVPAAEPAKLEPQPAAAAKPESVPANAQPAEAVNPSVQPAEVAPATDVAVTTSSLWPLPNWFVTGLIVLAAALILIGAFAFLRKKRTNNRLI